MTAPLGDPRLPERFWEKVDVVADGCWAWHASLTSSGYGQFYVAKRQPRRAHRVAYEALIGPIPRGLVLDHLCRNRWCANPDHCEPVPQRVNNNRGVGWSGQHAQTTHCPQGHPYAGENLRIRKSGSRACRACELSRNRAVRAARKAAA